MIHWAEEQRNRLAELLNQGVTIAYWCSDSYGRPANHYCQVDWVARPGLIQEVSGPLRLCSGNALHATLTPHRWQGSRVWVVALHGEVQSESGKLGSLKREIVGEVLPEEAFSPSVGVRLGRKDLAGADLAGAYLSRINLIGANLRGANLYGANLSWADLSRADLRGADLRGVNLYGANLYGANLYGANLNGADLSRADLNGAYLSMANLYGANLSGVDLSVA